MGSGASGTAHGSIAAGPGRRDRLATGLLDVVCEANLKLHDWAALVPVVEGAGGTMSDWNGEPLHAGSDGYVLAVGDPARLEDVVEALACGH